ncbi:MAG: L17 family ribosomal protein [Candidatus Dojkabacteria bacterium]|nr:MAG: L17 family ribosomal protein [Candidatus Dojkabacteria bacterium]
MRKRVKKLNLNQSTKAHDKLLAKNLFTSLLLYGKVVTTKPRASTLKAYALSKVNAFRKLTTSLDTKRWLSAELSTQAYKARATEKLKSFGADFAVSVVMTSPRKGDNAPQYEVSIINYEPKKTDEQ